MLKKKIAALLAAMMTISSLGTVAFAAGETYDTLLGNVIKNGTFEHGFDAEKDTDWGPIAGRITYVNSNTHDDSAGAILISPGAEGSTPVHSNFKVTPNKYYHAEAYAMLATGTSAEAELVIAPVDNNSLSTPIATAVENVNGTSWTKFECDFVSEVVDLGIYIKLADEQASFYLDNVIVKVTDYALPAGNKELVNVVDKDGNQYLAMKLVADSNGEVDLTDEAQTVGIDKKFVSRVMLDKNAQANSAVAEIDYTAKSEDWARKTVDLPKGEMVDLVFENPLTTRLAKTNFVYKISGATEGDIIYYCGSGVIDKATDEPAGAATAEITSFEVISGANTNAVIAPDANTVALRYFYYTEDASGSWIKIKSGHTNAGETSSVPPVYLDLSYAGKKIMLEVEPMNADCVYGEKKSLIATVKAPFEMGEAVSSAGTLTFDVGNYSGSQKNVAALVAYYNEKDEMVGIGIQNLSVNDNDSETYTVSVGNGIATDKYKIYILDGDITGSALALFPLAEAK